MNETLPHELIQHALSFLARDDHTHALRTARLVCKRWDRLIDSDVVWGRTLFIHPRRLYALFEGGEKKLEDVVVPMPEAKRLPISPSVHAFCVFADRVFYAS